MTISGCFIEKALAHFTFSFNFKKFFINYFGKFMVFVNYLFNMKYETHLG